MQLRTTLLTASLFSVLALAGASPALANAKPDGSFLTATIPGSTSEDSSTRSTAVGDVQRHTVSGESGDAELSITSTTLPEAATTITTDAMLYRKARNELLSSYSGQSKTWGTCTHAGFECRKLTYATEDGRKGVARFYLHEGVLVIVNATFGEDERAGRRFVNSARAS